MTEHSSLGTRPAGLPNPIRALLSLISALIFGPPIGGVVALTAFVQTGMFPEIAPGSIGISMIPAFFPLFYALGLIPAFAAGLVFAGVVWRHGTVSYRTTALVSLAGAAIATLLLVGPISRIPSRIDTSGLFVSIAAALIAALATRALIGAFGILRDR